MLVLRDKDVAPVPGQPEQAANTREHTRAEKVIVCAACHGTITSARHRIATHGAHAHRFMNPAGLLFHFGCFSEAIGCRIVGPDSLEYAWFPGLAWRFALCAGCGQHLGWHFRGERCDGFFGLILDRLLQPPTSD